MSVVSLIVHLADEDQRTAGVERRLQVGHDMRHRHGPREITADDEQLAVTGAVAE